MWAFPKRLERVPTFSRKDECWGGFPRLNRGPRKGEWPLWGEEKRGEQVELSSRKAEQCSRRFDDGASRASGCPPDTKYPGSCPDPLADLRLESCTKENDLVLANEVQE